MRWSRGCPDANRRYPKGFSAEHPDTTFDLWITRAFLGEIIGVKEHVSSKGAQHYVNQPFAGHAIDQGNKRLVLTTSKGNASVRT